MDIAASLWLIPCTFEELCKRLDKPEYGTHTIVNIILKKGWIYKKGSTLFCYKKTVKEVLNPAGYGLDLKEKYLSDFEKEYLKSFK